MSVNYNYARYILIIVSSMSYWSNLEGIINFASLISYWDILFVECIL